MYNLTKDIKYNIWDSPIHYAQELGKTKGVGGKSLSDVFKIGTLFTIADLKL